MEEDGEEKKKTYRGGGLGGESEDLSVERDKVENVKTYLWKGMERRK